MKKIWKVILSIVLIIIVGIAGTGYYLLKVKTYDVADKKVDEITKSEYKIELPGDTKPVKPSGKKGSNSPDNTATANNQTSNSQAESGKSNSSNSGTSANQSTVTQTEKVTAESIKEKYLPSFESLESQANSRIDSLIATAMNEYSSKKATGERISVGYFYQKYSGAGRSLEGQTDAAFNYIYGALQKDLKNNGLHPDSAKSIKASYEQTKKARESALIEKAKSAM